VYRITQMCKGHRETLSLLRRQEREVAIGIVKKSRVTSDDIPLAKLLYQFNIVAHRIFFSETP